MIRKDCYEYDEFRTNFVTAALGGALGAAANSTDVHPPPPVLEANSPPAAPTGLAAAAGDGSVTLSWAAADPNDNVIYYEYNVNHNDTSTGNLSGWTPWATVPGSGPSSTSHTFSGLTNGREYRYHLRAVNGNGVSVGAPASGPPWFVKAVPSAPPAAPTGLAASAGVASVTLTWNDPGDASITHYEYNVNHNATGTGNLTGWGPWTAIAGSGASTTSHTFSGLAGGREYRYHLRAVNGNGPSIGAPASGPPWFASATPIAPPQPPAPPTNLRVERVCDHKLKVRWHRSAGATGYDLEIGSANRKHWKRLLTNWPGNSWYATNWQKDRSYRFIARAVNDGGSSEWVESALSVAPPCAVGNLSVVTSTPGEGDIGAAGGDISASWNAGKRASAYNLHYNGSRLESGLTATSHSWSVGSRGASDSVSVQSVNGNMTSPSSSADVAWLTASNVKGTTATLDLAGHSGDWYVKRAAPTPAGSCESAGSGTTHSLTGLTASATHTFTAYGDSSCANAMATTTFSTTASLTVSGVQATSATLNLAGHNAQWWYDADTGPHTTCQGPVAAGTSTADLTGLTTHQQYTYTAYDAAGCGSGDALTSLTFQPSGDVLSVESVTATSATLKLENHTGNWWFKRTAPDAGNCTAGEADFTNDLTGLIPGTSYTYKAYSASGCGDTHESASVDFTTGGVSVSNLGEQARAFLSIGPINAFSSNSRAAGFTTGSASNDYELHSVTVDVYNLNGSPTGFTAAIHADSNGDPASSATHTLIGSAPTGRGKFTYECSGSCSLSADTDYFLVLSATGSAGHYYDVIFTESSNQTNIPSSADWDIASQGKYKSGNNAWQDQTVDGAAILRFKVSATVNAVPSLTASGISGTGATLTIAGHTGDWFYKGISGTEASSNCQDVYNSTTDTLSSLTADKLYGYTAHDHASCSSATELAREYFSTNDFDVGNLGEGASSDSYCGIGYISSKSRQCAVGFSTGSRSGGYTLKSVTGSFYEKLGNPGSIKVELHAADSGNASNPATTAISNATFAGSDPDTTGLYDFTCTGAGCSLSASTTYFLVMSTDDASGGNDGYLLETTNSDAEATHPDSNGWTIANVARSKTESNDWANAGVSLTGLVHIAADD